MSHFYPHFKWHIATLVYLKSTAHAWLTWSKLTVPSTRGWPRTNLCWNWTRRHFDFMSLTPCKETMFRIAAIAFGLVPGESRVTYAANGSSSMRWRLSDWAGENPPRTTKSGYHVSLGLQRLNSTNFPCVLGFIQLLKHLYKPTLKLGIGRGDAVKLDVMQDCYNDDNHIDKLYDIRYDDMAASLLRNHPALITQSKSFARWDGITVGLAKHHRKIHSKF